FRIVPQRPDKGRYGFLTWAQRSKSPYGTEPNPRRRVFRRRDECGDSFLGFVSDESQGCSRLASQFLVRVLQGLDQQGDRRFGVRPYLTKCPGRFGALVEIRSRILPPH